MVDRASALQEMVGEYDYERSLAASRLDSHQLRRGKLQLVYDDLVEHGQQDEADQVKLEMNNLDHTVQSDQETIARLDSLLGIYRARLDQLQSR